MMRADETTVGWLPVSSNEKVARNVASELVEEGHAHDHARASVVETEGPTAGAGAGEGAGEGFAAAVKTEKQEIEAAFKHADFVALKGLASDCALNKTQEAMYRSLFCLNMTEYDFDGLYKVIRFWADGTLRAWTAPDAVALHGLFQNYEVLPGFSQERKLMDELKASLAGFGFYNHFPGVVDRIVARFFSPDSRLMLTDFTLEYFKSALMPDLSYSEFSEADLALFAQGRRQCAASSGHFAYRVISGCFARQREKLEAQNSREAEVAVYRDYFNGFMKASPDGMLFETLKYVLGQISNSGYIVPLTIADSCARSFDPRSLLDLLFERDDLSADQKRELFILAALNNVFYFRVNRGAFSDLLGSVEASDERMIKAIAKMCIELYTENKTICGLSLLLVLLGLPNDGVRDRFVAELGGYVKTHNIPASRFNDIVKPEERLNFQGQVKEDLIKRLFDALHIPYVALPARVTAAYAGGVGGFWADADSSSGAVELTTQDSSRLNAGAGGPRR